MTPVLLAILLLFLFFSLAIQQNTSHTLPDKKHDEEEAPSQDRTSHPPYPYAPELLCIVLSMFYGILGQCILSNLPAPYHNLSALFWIVYLLLAPIAYGVFPHYIKLSPTILSIVCGLSLSLQKIFSLLSRAKKTQQSTQETPQSNAEFKGRLSEAASSFDKMIVREIMVPKVDIFALQEDTPICKAYPSIIEEGYSRVPLYKKSIDNITGILLVKDLLIFNLSPLNSSQPLSSVAKPPLYAPEIKKVSSLLQDFRQKHRHLAVIVNEYGVTEGIVSMEDIIEEIFGEIFDEYDVQEDLPYKKIGNFWIVDGRMNISDAEEHLNIKIHHANSYDTLGGHVFHKVGAVPQKGMKIHHDNFDIEIITCSERSVGKLKITPRKNKRSSQ